MVFWTNFPVTTQLASGVSMLHQLPLLLLRLLQPQMLPLQLLPLRRLLLHQRPLLLHLHQPPRRMLLNPSLPQNQPRLLLLLFPHRPQRFHQPLLSRLLHQLQVAVEATPWSPVTLPRVPLSGPLLLSTHPRQLLGPLWLQAGHTRAALLIPRTVS